MERFNSSPVPPNIRPSEHFSLYGLHQRPSLCLVRFCRSWPNIYVQRFGEIAPAITTLPYYPNYAYCPPCSVLSTLYIMFALYLLYYPHCTYCLHCTVLCTMYWNSLQADFFKNAGNLAKLKLLTLCCSHWQRCLYGLAYVAESKSPALTIPRSMTEQS